MRAFLWLFCVLCLLGAFCRFVFLVRDDYPRTMEWAAWEDALSLVLNLAAGISLLFLLI